MRELKITRSMILSFILGMSLTSLSIGTKVCIAVPLLLLWFMNYDEKKFDKRKKAYYE